MWYLALKISELPKDSGRSLEIASQRVALFNVGGKFYAMADSCMHRGGPLGDGHLEGTTVTCPWHAWDFDVKTGECLTMKGSKQKKFPVKTEGDGVYVEL